MRVTISSREPIIEQPVRMVIDLLPSEAERLLRFFNFHDFIGKLDADHPAGKLVDALHSVANRGKS